MNRLLIGVVSPTTGERCFDFDVSILTLGAECRALEVIDELGVVQEDKPPTRQAQSLIDLAYLAQQVRIVGIAPDELTPQFLQDNLATDDYLLIMQAVNALRKKCIDAGESQSDNAVLGDA